jgi:hypothetical protein
LVGFAGITISSFSQKAMGEYTDKQAYQIAAAQSLLGICAAIISTIVYGFVLKGIPIATSLWIAAVATTIMSAIRVAAPWLYFSSKQRGPDSTPAKDA